MGFGRKHPPSRSGANASLTAQAPALEPVSPLPRAVEAYVPPGSYGAAPHVPVTAYVPPLPPLVPETDAQSPLRIVTEDPLAFLAAQAAQHAADDEGGPRAPQPPTGRFRPTAVPPRERRGSVPPPGHR